MRIMANKKKKSRKLKKRKKKDFVWNQPNWVTPNSEKHENDNPDLRNDDFVETKSFNWVTIEKQEKHNIPQEENTEEDLEKHINSLNTKKEISEESKQLQNEMNKAFDILDQEPDDNKITIEKPNEMDEQFDNLFESIDELDGSLQQKEDYNNAVENVAEQLENLTIVLQNATNRLIENTKKKKELLALKK